MITYYQRCSQVGLLNVITLRKAIAATNGECTSFLQDESDS